MVLSLIVKELAEEFKGQLECLGENTEKYLTFSVPVKKELENDNTITYKVKFIDSLCYSLAMSSSLSSIVDNLSEERLNDKCKDCKFCLEYIQIKIINQYLTV